MRHHLMEEPYAVIPPVRICAGYPTFSTYKYGGNEEIYGDLALMLGTVRLLAHAGRAPREQPGSRSRRRIAPSRPTRGALSAGAQPSCLQGSPGALPR